VDPEQELGIEEDLIDETSDEEWSSGSDASDGDIDDPGDTKTSLML
jgi:hypothetical protein